MARTKTHPTNLLLAIDTSTRLTIVALGDRSGTRLPTRFDDVGGGALLEVVAGVLREAGATVSDVSGVIVGTGPGSFTGLRIGLAMAKTLAFTRRIDLIGIPSVEAMACALDTALGQEGQDCSIVMAAGARDHYLARVSASWRLSEPVRLLAPGVDLEAVVGSGTVLTVGLDAEALGPAAAKRGRIAVQGLGDALLLLGAAALAEGRRDDPATLVPLYVAVPRGVTASAKEMAWSPDRP